MDGLVSTGQCRRAALLLPPVLLASFVNTLASALSSSNNMTTINIKTRAHRTCQGTNSCSYWLSRHVIFRSTFGHPFHKNADKYNNHLNIDILRVQVVQHPSSASSSGVSLTAAVRLQLSCNGCLVWYRALQLRLKSLLNSSRGRKRWAQHSKHSATPVQSIMGGCTGWPGWRG